MHIVGEIKNDSPNKFEFVKITATLYDSIGGVVGTDFAYSDPSTLASGVTAPFEIIVLSASIPVEQIKEYKLSPSFTE